MFLQNLPAHRAGLAVLGCILSSQDHFSLRLTMSDQILMIGLELVLGQEQV